MSITAPPGSHANGQPVPVLLLLKGHPGSGKSTLARALARAMRWPLIDKDDARDTLQTVSTAATEAGMDLNRLAYNIMWRTVATQLSLGLSVVVDSPLARLELYQEAFALAQQHGATVALVDCQPGDAAAWRRRLEDRAALEAATHKCHKPQTWEQLQQLIARYNGCSNWNQDSAVNVPHQMSVDTAAGSVSESAGVVIQWLGTCGLVVPN